MRNGIKDNYYARINQDNPSGGPGPIGFDNAKIKNEDGRKVLTLIPNSNINMSSEYFTNIQRAMCTC